MTERFLHGPNSPAPGQIGLVHQTDIGAKVISLFEGGSPVTHCVLALEDDYVISAEPHGARIRNVWEIEDVAWSDFPLSYTERKVITETGRALSGTPYAFLDDFLVGLALLRGGRHDPRWMKHEMRQTDRLQCAQLVDLAYNEAGIHLFNDGRPFGAVYPASFVPVFTERGWLDL